MFMPGRREQAWSALEQPLDLLVIGGGITGAGILHDAALRGLRVALVERGDFACGTSSRSSKLIHGGLRYLRKMQLRITRTACRERDLLARNNPHLVSPVRFLYPSYASDPTPGWQVNLGLAMYDHLTAVPHRHEKVDRQGAARLVPELALEDLEFGLLYDDAVGDDARLVLAVIEAGVLAGGVALNYAGVEELIFGPGDRVVGAAVRDLAGTGVRRVFAAVVVNSTGVWCDEIRAMMGKAAPRLRPSRGSHLLFPRHRLALQVAVTALSPDDGRPVFAVPHAEGTLIGTTDLFHFGPLENPRPDREEVAYLMRFAQTLFPSSALTVADVCGAFAGVRPILDSHADEPSEASREEAIWEENGMVSTAGGKLTTFRATAEEVVDAAVKLLPEERRDAVPAGGTAAVALPQRLDPAKAIAALRSRGVVEPVAAALVRRLGAAALPCALTTEARSLRPLAEGVDLCAAEVAWHLRFGAVVHLDDLLLRRVRLGMWQPKLCLAVAPRLRRLVRPLAGWGFARWKAELKRLNVQVANWLPPEPP